jgi:hypothetical protein
MGDHPIPVALLFGFGMALKMPAGFGLSGMTSIHPRSRPIANKPVVQLPMLSLPPLALAHHLLLSRK